MDTQTEFVQLMDTNQPNWVFDLADQTDLRDMATGRINLSQLQHRVFNRLWQVIHSAAIMAAREIENTKV